MDRSRSPGRHRQRRRGGRVPLFGTGIHVTGGPAEHGIVGWEWSGLDPAVTDIDGVPTQVAAPAAPVYAAHPLGATRVDHVVVATDSLARTCGAIADATGAPLKRVRETGEMRQGFHRVGGLVVEVVERTGLAEGPASLWGLAICVEDLDAAVRRHRRRAHRRADATRCSPVAASPRSARAPASACRSP